MSSEMIYHIGLATIGISIVVVAIVAPILLIVGSRINKKLETDYGKNERRGKN